MSALLRRTRSRIRQGYQTRTLLTFTRVCVFAGLAANSLANVTDHRLISYAALSFSFGSLWGIWRLYVRRDNPRG